MEQRRLDISRRTSDLARQQIADIVKNSVLELRGELPEEIDQVVNNLSFTTSHIPDITFTEGDLLKEQAINNLLELMYTDSLVQYGDIFAIQDILTSIKGAFESAISSNVIKAAELATRARAYKALSSQQFSFTDVFHESFDTARNSSRSDFKCSINTGAGVMRMPGLEENYARHETSDVKLNVFSEAVKIVDENESTNAYGDDMTEPYFVTVFAAGNPSNRNIPSVLLSEKNGLIVDATIRFNTIVPVTRINLTPFSTAPIDLIGVFYSVTPEAEWDTGEIRIVKRWNLSYDTSDLEVNFPRVYAREIHVLIHQQDFALARADLEVEDILSSKDYIEKVAESLGVLMPTGFVEHIDLDTEVSEITTFLVDKAAVPSEKPAPNTRSYVIGLCNLKVSNVTYSHFGDYLGSNRSVRGNLHSVSFTHDGDITRSDGESSIDYCALFSVQCGGKTIYIGYSDDEDRAIDAAVIQANYEYVEGAMVKHSTHPYKFETHFRPTDTLTGFEMFSDGYIYTLPSDVQIEMGSTSAVVKLPEIFCLENNLLEGTILTMHYDLASYDEIGRPYSVSQVRIADRIGRPNIAVNEAAYVRHNYLYLPALSGENWLSYAPELSEISPAEWDTVTISGEIFYHVTSDKGVEIDGQKVITEGGNIYAHESIVSGPFDDFYYGSLREEPTFVMTSGIVHIMETDVPYIKGTLKGFVGDKIISHLTECDVDTVGNVLTNDEKRRFIIPNSYDVSSVRICYVPIDPTATTSTLASNIASYNETEQFAQTKEGKITLSAYPFNDYDIISSTAWAFRDGVFYLKWKYSVTYEPVVVFVNGAKALNITEYRKGGDTRPQFRKSFRPDDYQFYIENGNTLVFNQDVTGTILVYYYRFTDQVRDQIEMFRSNYGHDDATPEIYNYTILANIQR